MLRGMKRTSVLFRVARLVSCLVLLMSLASLARVQAAGLPSQTGTGSVGLQGTISSGAPTRPATISVPVNGAVYTEVPITVSGLCPNNTLVKIFDNNVFVGSALCVNGSYTLQISLFNGQNDLIARVYDSLDQAGPDSATTTVTYNDSQFAQFGTHVALTSVYAERGGPPGQEISWAIILSGGIGPYAISVDWGDGSSSDLFTQTATGTFTIKHTYKSAGIYRVIVKATDKNGGIAFLQLVAQATGATQSNSKGGSGSDQIIKTDIIWWPVFAMLPLIVAAFWVGRRYELYVLRKHLEKSSQR